MYWYWKVRIYNPQGHYANAWVRTERNLHEIDTIQDFYRSLTDCKMILEGMSEVQPINVFTDINTAFNIIFKSANEQKAANDPIS